VPCTVQHPCARYRNPPVLLGPWNWWRTVAPPCSSHRAAVGPLWVSCTWPAGGSRPQPTRDSILTQRLPSMLIVDPAAAAPHCVQHLLCTLEITDQELTCRFFRRPSCATATVPTEALTCTDGIVGTHRFTHARSRNFGLVAVHCVSPDGRDVGAMRRPRADDHRRVCWPWSCRGGGSTRPESGSTACF
jgi:hypothetical protein